MDTTTMLEQMQREAAAEFELNISDERAKEIISSIVSKINRQATEMEAIVDARLKDWSWVNGFCPRFP